MRILIFILLGGTLLCLSACTESAVPAKSELRTVQAGEKATAGHLTYSVVDSQIMPQLGDDSSPRVPRDRFILVQVAVTNSSNVDNPIPAIELVGDSGKIYDELADGTGVTNWLGVVRHVGPNQTERGEVVFDAPAAHYKLRFTDESDDTEVMADLPLSYAYERMDDETIPTADLPDVTAPTGSQNPK